MSISAGKSEDDEKGESNDEALATTGTNYLVCMCYGTPDAYDLKENLRFVFVSGDDILYDEECVTVSKWKDYDIPNNPFHGVGKRSIEGIMVITFELNAGKDGKLYIDHEEGTQGRPVLLESPVGSIADGAEVSVDRVNVAFTSAAGRICVCENGAGIDFSEETAKQILLEKEIGIEIALGDGDGYARAWGCDLTYDYVKINGDYRT
jgi:hypothetical protein